MKKSILILLFIAISLCKVNGQYVINGNTVITGPNEFQLTQDANLRNGSVWYQTKLNLNFDFQVQGQVYLGIHDISGADGIAFVLQPLSVNTGGFGGGIGYEGITPSLDVEFDTYQNFLEPFDDHVAINKNGSVDHSGPNVLLAPYILPNIEDGNWHNVIFSWTAATHTLMVTFDGTPHSIVYDLITNIFGGNQYVYWGFTAATGGSTNDQRVRIGEVTFVEEITIHGTVTDAACGGATGAVNVTVTGGTGGYTYSWSGNGISNTSQNISGLLPGDYTVIVTDNTGNTSSATFTVQNLFGTPPSCNITVVPSNNIYTGGNPNVIYLGYGPQSVTLNSNASNGNSFTYSWTGSNLSCTNCASTVFTPTHQGFYSFSVLVTSGNGCTTTCYVSICVLDVRVPGQNGKVYLCHAPNGNPSNTLSISANAVPAHLTHPGDHLGKCNQTCNPGKVASDIDNSSDYEGSFAVYPNPSKGQFEVALSSVESSTAVINVYSVDGAIIETRNIEIKEDGNVEKFNFEDHPAGIYFVQLINNNKVTIQKVIIKP